MNCETIVLAHRDYGERDRLYTLFTRERGKLTVRGSGARKSGAKLAPHLEPLMRSHIVIAKNRGRGTVTFALCEESFAHLREEALALEAARGVVAATEKLLRDEDPHTDVYDTLLTYLRTMEVLSARTVSWRTYAVVTQGTYFHILSRLGWHVSPTTCVRCGGRLAQHAQYTYVLSEGGFVCASCYRASRVPAQHSLELSRDAVAALHVFCTNTIPSLAKLTVGEDVCDELALLTARRIAWVS